MKVWGCLQPAQDSGAMTSALEHSSIHGGSSPPHIVSLVSVVPTGNFIDEYGESVDLYFLFGRNWDNYFSFGEVKRLIAHPSYNDGTLQNDIALVEFQSPVTDVDVMPLNTDSITNSLVWRRASKWLALESPHQMGRFR